MNTHAICHSKPTFAQVQVGPVFLLEMAWLQFEDLDSFLLRKLDLLV